MADDGPPPETIQASNAPTAPDGSRDWEKPWTITEMRHGANNWSLSGDSRLLLYLQDFSQKMISRVHEIEKEVDGLMNESKLTSVRLNNVFNDFIMLANTQFVENRVYDEDVSQEDSAKSGDQQEEKEKTREEREAELIPRVKEALMLGIDVIDKAFDQLDSHAADSDSEDDDTAYRVDPILEAKDPYLNRPLPLMIGEPKFMEDDTVGLMEVESEGEESDVGSISESEDDDEKKPPLGSDDSSDEETDSEEESDEEKPVKKPAKKADSESEDESDGDLFGEKEEKSENDAEEEEEEEGEDEEEEEEEVEKKIPKPSGPGGFAAELAKKLGAPVPQGPADSEEEEEEEIVKPKAKKGKGGKKAEKKEERSDSKGKKGKKNKKQEDDEPFPADDEDDSPFGNKGGLFASKGGLFDDDDDDDGGLFDEVMGNKPKKKSVKEEEEEENEDEEEEEVKVEKKPRKRTISGKKVPAGGVSIFGDDGDGLFGKKSSKQEAPEKPKAGGGGLFDDEEDDLFSSPSENTAKPVKKEKEAVKTKPAGGLFEDEDDEDDLFSEAKTKKEEIEEQIQEVKKEEKKEKKKEKKPPPGAVPMFGGGMNPLAAAIKKRKPDSDEEDKEDWSDEEKPRSASVKSNQSASSINSKPILKPNKPSPSPSSNSLFDDDADDALFSAPAKPRADSKSKAKQTKSLFDDEGDALFGSTAPKPTQPKKKEEKTKAGSLFDNEESDEGEDLFGVPAKTKDSEKKKPVGGVSLFGGADVLGVKPKQEEKITEKKQEAVKPKSPATNKLSLFDEDEEEDDLFGGGATPVKSGKPASAPLGKPMPKGKDLFEDEDLLFGENQGESPGVDIFSKSPPEAPKSDGQMDVEGATITESSDSKPEVPPEEPKPRKPVGGVSMFGGLDPMAALKKKEPKEPIAEEKPPAPTVKKEPPKKAVKPADSLFGDDEEEEDLFGGSSSKAVPSKPPPPKDDLFGSPKSDDDLFSPKPSQKPEEKKEEPAEIKPKKPAGAVSMFGGMDPFSAMKKKSSSVEDKEKEDKPYNEKPAKDNIFGSPKSDDDLFGSSPKQQVNQAEEKEESTEVKPRRPPGAVSMFGNVDPFAAMKKKSPSVEDTGDVSPKSPSTDDTNTTGKPTSKIGKLKMNIGINPAALLPGAAPPNKEPETTPVGFDTPAEAKTLHSANKDRAKIQTKRRPPSRRGRQTSSESVQPMLNGLSEESSAAVAASGLPDLPPLENDRVPSASTDLFGNDDLLGESVPSLMPQTQKSSGSQIVDVFSKDKDDLFSSKRDKEKPSMTNDDLFGAVKTEGRTKSKHALPVDDDDDIFSSSSVKPKKATALESAILNGGKDTKTEKSKESEKKSVLDDDDDIFAKPKKRATDFEKLFDKDAEDDKSKDISKKESKPNVHVEEEDIFADSSLSKKKESKVKKDEEAVEEEKKSSKADEDADDIFAVKTTKKVKARPKTKDEDLFKDDTDIFADVPAAKPKEKKKKKVTEKKTGIFKDDVDDIFADVSTPKAKKDKKKTETSKSKTKSIDVNDIFDDPLK